MADLLSRALDDAPPGDLSLRPLPVPVADLLRDLQASPRLGAHLRLVHEVACLLTERVRRQWPGWEFDAAAVHFGAAVHDIGKVLHPQELSGPGSAHEPAGHDLLIAHGIPPEQARFARTHGTWRSAEVGAEDLLVSLADKVWKGHRVTDLEQLVLDRIATAAHRPAWETFLALDEILGELADGADARLAFQADHPIHG